MLVDPRRAGPPIRRIIAAVTSLLLLAAVAACTPHHRTNSGPSAITAFAASTGVDDGSLLPRDVPPVTATAATAHAVAARLTKEAHEPSAAGLVALVQLAGLADMPIVDAGEAGRVIEKPAHGREFFPIEAGQLLVIHELLAGGTTTSLADLTGLMHGALTNTAATPDPAAVTAIGADLRSASAGSAIGPRIWADAILTSNAAGETLTASPADVRLDGLQVMFLLLELEHEALVQAGPGPGVSASPADGSLSPAAEAGGCDLEDEIKQEIFDLGISTVGSAKDGVHDAWLDRLLEEIGLEGTEGVRFRNGLASVVSVIMPMIEMIVASVFFSTTITPDAPRLVRTKSATKAGGYAPLTASFKFAPKDTSHFTHCAALFMSGLLTDVTVASSGEMRGTGVTWDLVSGGAGGSGDRGFVDLCGTACGSGQQVMGYTDESGAASMTLEGLKQRKDMSDARVSVERTATVQAAVNPKDLANRAASAVKTLSEAIGTALGAALLPPVGLTRLASRMFYEFGGLSASKQVTVRDWVDGFDLSYDLRVHPAWSPGLSSSGFWEVTSTVHLGYDPADGLYAGSAPLTYAASSVNETYREQANSGSCNCYYPPQDAFCNDGVGGCPITGCFDVYDSHPEGTVAGTLTVVMTLNHDAAGQVTGIKDITYNIEGIKEKMLDQNRRITGVCTLKTGGRESLDQTEVTDNVYKSWKWALSSGTHSDVTPVRGNNGFTRTGFGTGSAAAPVLGHVVEAFPAVEVVQGQLREEITVIDPSN